MNGKGKLNSFLNRATKRERRGNALGSDRYFVHTRKIKGLIIRVRLMLRA